MPVLIDGNNLLYAARDAEPERPPGPTLLCQTLGAWVRAGRANRVQVVFDGIGPQGERAQQVGDPDITVTFSGADASADDVIIRLVRQAPTPRRLLVVSTDRAIVKAARARRAQNERSEAFWTRVRRELRAGPPEPPAPEKPETPDSAEVEEWLRRFSQ